MKADTFPTTAALLALYRAPNDPIAAFRAVSQILRASRALGVKL